MGIKGGLMKKMIIFLMMILMVITAACFICYKINKTPDKICGYIYVRSERPVNIIFTNGLGYDEIIKTDELDAPFELCRAVQVFDYRIIIFSDLGPQTFMLKVYFEGADSDNNFERVIYEEEEYEHRGRYFPPWSDLERPNVNL